MASLTTLTSSGIAGNPTDSTRATVTVAGQNQSCAIWSQCAGCDNISVQNIQVYGARDTMGYNSGIALLEMGGTNSGQTIQNCHIWEPRGWSALHGIGALPSSFLPLRRSR